MAGVTAAAEDGLHKVISYYDVDRGASMIRPWNFDRIVSYLAMVVATGEAIWELQYSCGTGNKSKHKAKLLLRWGR